MDKHHNQRILIFLAILITSCASSQLSDQPGTPIVPTIVHTIVPNTLTLQFTQTPKITFTPSPVRSSSPTGTSLQVTTSTITIPTAQPEICGSSLPGRSIFIDENPTFRIRQGPGCEYEEFQGTIVKPDPLTFFNVLGKYNDWLLADLCNGKQGWIFAPAIADLNLDVALDDLPLITPVQTPAKPAASLSQNKSSAAVDQASKTLISFFDLLNNQNYAEAVQLFAGGYGAAINWNPDVDPEDYPALLERACEWNGFQCFLRVSKIINAEQVSPMEFHFIVELINPDGSLYQRRGVNDTTVTQFLFRVARDCNGKYFVVDWPFYEQYSG